MKKKSTEDFFEKKEFKKWRRRKLFYKLKSPILLFLSFNFFLFIFYIISFKVFGFDSPSMEVSAKMKRFLTIFLYTLFTINLLSFLGKILYEIITLRKREW